MLFVDQYNWKDINFPTGRSDWKKFKRNKKLIHLNILYVEHNIIKTSLAYKSKHDKNLTNHVTLLMTADGENSINLSKDCLHRYIK